MLSQEQRNIKPKPVIHILQSIKERRYLFPSNYRFIDCYNECISAIKDPLKGIIIPDTREKVQSEYVCIFVGITGHLIAIPLTFSDGFLIPLTIKDVRSDFNNPNWCVKPYNEIAEKRGLPKLSWIYRT